MIGVSSPHFHQLNLSMKWTPCSTVFPITILVIQSDSFINQQDILPHNNSNPPEDSFIKNPDAILWFFKLTKYQAMSHTMIQEWEDDCRDWSLFGH